MGFLGWMTLAGVLLLVMTAAPAIFGRLPVATSLIYLGLGIAIGPAGAGWLVVDLSAEIPWLERVTEVAVIVSLFVGGLKLRLPLTNPAWRAAFLLAGPVMLATIVGVAALAHFALGLGVAAALLLGAVLAPTDPVLAAAVSVKSADDRDHLRYAISGEAGLNDGMAFPFVVFALLWATHEGPGSWIGTWTLHRILYAVPMGLLLGYAMGRGAGLLAVKLRAGFKDSSGPADFQALALIALSYVAADSVGAWGFLSTFAAGLGLRHAEIQVMREHPSAVADAAERGVEAASAEVDERPPAEALVGVEAESADPDDPAVATGVMVAETITFGGTAERLMEVLLVVLVGAALALHWDPRALPLAAALFLLIRPLTTQLLLAGSPVQPWQRWIMGWFGIRGIGSLYYMSYALSHGASGPGAAAVVDLTISTVALSIVVHGATVNPLLAWYERRLPTDPAPS